MSETNWQGNKCGNELCLCFASCVLRYVRRKNNVVNINRYVNINRSTKIFHDTTNIFHNT